jgi:hypothetical protein
VLAITERAPRPRNNDAGCQQETDMTNQKRAIDQLSLIELDAVSGGGGLYAWGGPIRIPPVPVIRWPVGGHSPSSNPIRMN